MTDTIANMTKDELKKLIYNLMEERRLQYLFGELHQEEGELEIDDEPDNRMIEEVFASIESNRWTPPSGSPSPSQLIREDRDSR